MATADDHLAARDTLLGLFFAADRRDWDSVRTSLADTVHLDYTSLNGGAPVAIDAGDLIAAWQGLLPGFDATHHQLVVVRSTETTDGIEVVANGTATHRLATRTGGDLWTVAGYYEASLQRTDESWVITALTFTATWGSGNQQLTVEAQDRVNRDRG